MTWFKLSLYSGFNSVHRRHGSNCRYIQVFNSVHRRHGSNCRYIQVLNSVWFNAMV